MILEKHQITNPKRIFTSFFHWIQIIPNPLNALLSRLNDSVTESYDSSIADFLALITGKTYQTLSFFFTIFFLYRSNSDTLFFYKPRSFPKCTFLRLMLYSACTPAFCRSCSLKNNRYSCLCNFILFSKVVPWVTVLWSACKKWLADISPNYLVRTLSCIPTYIRKCMSLRMDLRVTVRTQARTQNFFRDLPWGNSKNYWRRPAVKWKNIPAA